jgi:hypothetical protein
MSERVASEIVEGVIILYVYDAKYQKSEFTDYIIMREGIGNHKDKKPICYT